MTGFRKLTGMLHLWLGLVSGLIVFIVSLTGCLYVFESEIQSLYNGPYTRVPAQNGPLLPVSELAWRGWQALSNEVNMPERFEYATVSLYSDPAKAAYYYVYDDRQNLQHYVHLNPYTGAVLKVRDMHTDPFAIILRLHTSLLLQYEEGHKIVGTAVLIFVISLLTGLVLWWPRNKAALKQRFSVKWSARWRRVNYDSHNVFGFYSLLPALLIAVTGLVWSFDWVEQGLYFLFTGRTDVPAYFEPTSRREPPRTDTVLDRSMAQTRGQYPTAAYYSVSLPAADTSSIAVSAYPNEATYYDATTFFYNQYTGQLLGTDRLETQNLGQKARLMNYDVHIGKILGLPGQLLAFFASLVSASLPVTGFLIWWGRRKKKRPAAVSHPLGRSRPQTASKTVS
ncbi:putative iron-regulated membrane protein [Spirosoma lacussanchae]|uniref:PepSY-associated TM helix domain-containing protein n=1 Tax=Spirosoma lacussanchae TaxID=1884249 RepID=UPI001108DA54|nr:PepSY-associated TM helix domain-containing protein [Spirosoma lacussanchae]